MEEKDLVIVYDIYTVTDTVFSILDLILQGDEIGVFDEFVGDDANDFVIISSYYGFTKKRMKEICKIWNKANILGLKATPINQVSISFKSKY